MDIGKNLMGYFNGEPKKEEPTPPVQEIAEQPKEETTVESVTDSKDLQPTQAEAPKEEPKEQPKPEEPKQEEPKPEQPKAEPIELSDDMVTEYLAKKSGKEIKSIDDLFKEPDAVDDPVKDLPEEIQQFVKYAKETGRSFEDWTKLNADYTQISPIDAARLKAKEITGGELNDSEIDEYLEKKLNIDLSADELDKFDAIELKNFGKDYIEKLKSDQEKYKTPIEKAPEQEMLTLENGQKISKAEYNKLVEARNQYLNGIKAAADKITEAKFKISIDEKGEKKEMELGYEYSKEDVHNMTSMASDLDATMTKLFKTENGFDHAALQEAMHWINPEGRAKTINAIVHKALAQQAEELLKDEYNPKFSQPKLPSNGDGSKKLPVQPHPTAGKVKYDFSKI